MDIKTFERVITAFADGPTDIDFSKGKMIVQPCVGGYIYLRSLVGPEEICYLFVDNPALVHKMMRAWLELADAV
ncbi:MAG: hypothetical protein ABSA30_05950, partial [Candidatus Aminicenantales bacterium]